jgi:hypothetical protein
MQCTFALYILNIEVVVGYDFFFLFQEPISFFEKRGSFSEGILVLVSSSKK